MKIYFAIVFYEVILSLEIDLLAVIASRLEAITAYKSKKF